MTPMERLLAEELPTGTFGDAPSTRAKTIKQERTSAITDAQAAANRQALEVAIGGKSKSRRHLRAVPERSAA